MAMKERDELQLKKGDCFILLGVAITVLVLVMMIFKTEQGNQVYVTVAEKTTAYSLFDDQTIFISNNEEQDPTISACFLKNTIVIENGEVRMEQATCPDQVCVRHKPISKNGEMIICLPNKVYVEVKSDMNSEIDN